MKNKLSDLNNHLFAQLELLTDESLSATRLELEATRPAAIVDVSEQILSVADTQIKIAKMFVEHGPVISEMLPQIGVSK